MRRTFTSICLLILTLAVAPAATAQAAVKVAVEGLETELEKNVLAFLTIEQQKKAEDLTEQRIRRYHATAPDEIRTALQPFGYYQPEITSTLKRSDDTWFATYSVDAGPPVRVTVVDIRVEGPGRQEPELLALVDELALKTGDRLVHADYERARNRLQTAALNLGYRDASYTQREVRVLRADNRAEITLHLDTGDRYFFGPVTFKGSELREKLLRAYIPFREGDAWSNRKIIELQRALANSHYFANIELLPQTEEAQERRIPLEVRLTPSKKHRYGIGVGYTTNTGPRFTLGWQHRQVNRRGHRFVAATEYSAVRRSLTGKYSIPLSKPLTDVLDLAGTIRQEDTDTSKSLIHELRASHAIQRNKLQTTSYISYKNESYEIGSDDNEDSNLLIPGIIWTWVDADSRLITRRGTRLQLEIKGTARALASDTTFTQGLLQLKTIQPLGARGRVILRADLGGTGLADVDSLPASNRFFAGGDQSVRGYDYQDLGPEDSDGEVTGGRQLLVGSIEYNHRILEKWHAAVFFDAGNAFNDLPVDEQHGAGIGIRWESPVGMLRLDVAAALSKEDNPLRLHFSFGPDL